LVIVAKKATPANDLRGFIDWLKAKPEKASFATSGVGSPPHIAGVLFQKLTGIPLQFVHYRGSAPAVQDLVGGQIDMGIDSPTTTLPQARAGSIKAYAVTAKSRLSAAPDIPTVDEAGLPGMYLSVWFGLWAPKGTTKDGYKPDFKGAAIQGSAIACRVRLSTSSQILTSPPFCRLPIVVQRRWRRSQVFEASD
jgi:tripartite-type tricarboxylate transporter receptor subunit TctC